MKKLLPFLGCFLLLTWLAGALSPRAAFLAGNTPMPAISETQADKFTNPRVDGAWPRGILQGKLQLFRCGRQAGADLEETTRASGG